MRKKIVFCFILFLGALVLVGAGCGKKETGEESLTDVLSKAKEITAYRYDVVMTSPGESAITTKFWLKGDKMRWEGNYEGRDVVYIIDQSAEIAYLYIPAQKMAMKMDFSKAEETVGESAAEQSGSIEQYNPATLGTEVLDGKTCLVVEYSDQTSQIKMWLWTKYGIPVRTETTTAKGTAVAEIKNIEFGDIADSMFELPAGVQPTSIPSFSF